MNKENKIPEPVITQKNNCKFLLFSSFSDTKLAVSVYSTRTGGISPAPFNTMNLGTTTNDKIENIIENRKIFSKATGVTFKNTLKQIHGTKVIILNNIRKNNGSVVYEKKCPIGDALITNIKKNPLVIMVADCYVIYFLDPLNKAIGIAHAGWRGTAENISGEVLKQMNKEYGTLSENCIIGISPGIGRCCFEVDEDVFKEFKKAGFDLPEFLEKKDNKWHIDLLKINLYLLKKNKVKEENISYSTLCTSCNKELFYSYRREKGNTGRMAGAIMLS